jgi:hypothetical protein
MDVFGQLLDARQAGDTAEDRRRAAEAWQLTGQRAEVRVIAFDRWVRLELEARLQWEWAGAAKEKRIEQFRVRLEQVVLDLWRRGWMLDGKRLAIRIVALLDAVGAYQRKGTVQDFWAYFNAAVERYVGANAEEIQAEAMRAGAHMGAALSALLKNAGPKDAALPELLAQRADEVTKAKAETLREKTARERARQAACKADAQQTQLF